MGNIRIDWWIFLPILFLSILSLVLLGSTTPYQAQAQAIAILISLVIYIFTSRIRIDTLLAFHHLLYFGSLLFLLLPFAIGLVSRGATRWIQIGSSSIQPSEIVKPFLLLTFVSLANSDHRLKHLFLILAFLVPALIIFFQPDLGTLLVIGVGWLTIFASRMRTKFTLAAFLILIMSALPVYLFALRPYQRERLITFVNPYHDPLGSGYHVIQSIIAVGSGQLTGLGLGHGSQSQLQFLPESHTDFIFATLSESFGFVGSTIVIGLYAVLLTRLYRLSQSSSSPKNSQWLLAVMAMLAFQIWVNIGMNIGLAPVTGITLPFLSYGGSSLVSLALIFGLANSMGRSNSTLL